MRSGKMLRLEQFRQTALHRALAMALLISITALCLCLPALAQTKYVITDGDSVIVCMSNSSDPQVVIQEAGLELGESDTYTTQRGDGISEIHINRVQMVAVHEGAQLTMVGSYGGTVADVLASLDMTLSPSDVLSCALDTETYDGMSISITRVTYEDLEYDEIIPHGVKIYEDDSLEPDQELVLVEGVNGLTHVKAQVTYEDGVETGRAIVSQQVVTAPTDALILRGVDRSVKEQEHSGSVDYRQSNTSKWTQTPMTTAATQPSTQSGTAYIPGTTQSYRTVLTCTATAYTCSNESGITATGTVARVGAIAVDPNVIPLGTKMYIVSADGQYVYGYCVAEDTGGAIKGNTVDLYYNTYDECIQFGRRSVLVYILD